MHDFFTGIGIGIGIRSGDFFVVISSEQENRACRRRDGKDGYACCQTALAKLRP